MRNLFMITLAIFFILSCSPDNKNLNICKIKYIEGKAYEYKSPNANPVLITTGSKLSDQSIIKTDKNSIVDLEFADKSVLRIQENSRIKIKNFFNNNSNYAQTDIYIELGKIFAKLEHYLEGQKYEIETDSVFINAEGGEFVVTVAEDKITKVAVREGTIYYSNKLNIDELNALNKINPDFAKKIKNIITQKKQLKVNEKIETSNENNSKYIKKISYIVSLINQDLQKYKNDKRKTEEIVKKYSNDIENFASYSSPLIFKGEVSNSEWNNEFSADKNKMIRLENIQDLSVDKNSKIKFTNPIKKEEKKIVYKSRIKKLLNKPNIKLTELNTGFSSDLQNIYIASNYHNTIYCVNPVTGHLNWQFNSPELQNIYSTAISYKSNILIGTMDRIFLLNNSGDIRMVKEINNGIQFWSSPIIYDKKLYIPTSSTVYEFDGKDFKPLENLPETNGQLFISAYKANLFILEMTTNILHIYDFNKKQISWESSALNNKALISPLVTDKYVIIADIKENIYRFAYHEKPGNPSILNIRNGVSTNMIVGNNYIYFVGMDGYFCRVNINSFNSLEKIMKVESNLEPNKFLTKKMLYLNNDIFFNSDYGKLFVYNTITQSPLLMNIPENKNNLPLIGTPVNIGNVIFFMDLDGNIYKYYEEISPVQ